MLQSDSHGRPLARKAKLIAKDAQQLGVRLLQDAIIKHYEVLSLDILGNGLNAISLMKAMYKDKRLINLDRNVSRKNERWKCNFCFVNRNEESWLSPNQTKVAEIAQRLGKWRSGV